MVDCKYFSLIRGRISRIDGRADRLKCFVREDKKGGRGGGVYDAKSAEALSGLSLIDWISAMQQRTFIFFFFFFFFFYFYFFLGKKCLN